METGIGPVQPIEPPSIKQIPIDFVRKCDISIYIMCCLGMKIIDFVIDNLHPLRCLQSI